MGVWIWLSLGEDLVGNPVGGANGHRGRGTAAQQHDQHPPEREALPHADPQPRRALVIHGARVPAHRVSAGSGDTENRGPTKPRHCLRLASPFGQPALAGRLRYPHPRVLSPRNRELLGLLPAALLVTAGFTAIFIQEQSTSAGAAADVTLNQASTVSLTYGAIFLGLCLAGHLVIRFALPNADPYLFPLGAVLASVGIVMVYRINPTLARQQAQWMVLGLVLFAATILVLRRTGWGCWSATATRSSPWGSA